jgi:environmental stress-induced protein Ves
LVGALESNLKMLTELIAANNFKRMPWKNGKGKRIELIAIHDPPTSELLCRLSIASVTLDDDFSDFSGCKRTLMMIAGNGMALLHQSKEAQIPTQTLTRQYQYCSFDGGWKTKAKLIDGPITDFNIIFNPQRVSSKVFVLKEGEVNEIENHADELFLFAHKEPSTCPFFDDKVAKEIAIPIGDLLHITASDAAKMTITGEGLIYVGIVNR